MHLKSHSDPCSRSHSVSAISSSSITSLFPLVHHTLSFQIYYTSSNCASFSHANINPFYLTHKIYIQRMNIIYGRYICLLVECACFYITFILNGLKHYNQIINDVPHIVYCIHFAFTHSWMLLHLSLIHVLIIISTLSIIIHGMCIVWIVWIVKVFKRIDINSIYNLCYTNCIRVFTYSHRITMSSIRAVLFSLTTFIYKVNSEEKTSPTTGKFSSKLSPFFSENKLYNKK